MIMPAHLVKNSLSFVVIWLSVAVINTAAAHHSVFTVYLDTFVELEGVVTGIDLRNPHISLTMLIENESGEETWELAGDSANAVQRRGITRDTLRVGDGVWVLFGPRGSTHVTLP